MKTNIAVIFITVSIVASVFAGERRYVVTSKTAGITFNEYALWTDAGWANSCSRAVIGGTKADQNRFCKDGFSGLKPKIGSVVVGTEVELLDSRECAPMAYVRILAGNLKGETGCMSSAALSSVKAQIEIGPVAAQPPAISLPVPSNPSDGADRGTREPPPPSSPVRGLQNESSLLSPKPVSLINRGGNTIACPPESTDPSGFKSCVGNAESQGFVRLPDVSAGMILDWHGKPLKIVQVGGAAAEAGLRVGDLLLELNGNKIVEPISIFKIVGKKQPGDYIIVKIVRDGKPMNFTYRLVAK